MPNEYVFVGLIYEDGELRRSEIMRDGEYVSLWVGGEYCDDVNDVDDINGALFFEDKEHFAGWVFGHLAALTPEEVWPSA